ncbi:MAG TPA: hypothetical protein VJR47_09585 [Stellaceae bacterium]|nr:hypothetical protein [Stellaceae bacterium]
MTPDDEARRVCSYIAAGTWRSGAAPFCGAPALPGSSYCAVHAPLCGVDPASQQGARIAAEQDEAAAAMLRAPSPRFAACAVPEPVEEDGSLEDCDLPRKFSRGAGDE